MPITTDDGERIARLSACGLSYDDIARKLHCTRNQVAGALHRWRAIPTEFQRRSYNTALQLSGDFMICGDVHVPCTDWEFANLLPKVAQKNDIKQMIIAGDLFNMDMFSQYAKTGRETAWAEERDAARVLLSTWLSWFEKIYIIQGNHDRRLSVWAQGQLDEGDIIGMVTSSDKVVSSEYGYCTVISGEQTWRITHSKNYSVNTLTIGHELANKHQAHIISHHQHHLAQGWDKYKRFVIVDNGALVDQAKLAYVMLDDSKMPNMANGFTVLRNGVAKVYGKYPFTDWESVL